MNAPVEQVDRVITCASTHCERRQECCSPNDCSGSAKRKQTPCEHCGARYEQAIPSDTRGIAVIRCDGCKAFVSEWDMSDEGARP